MSSSINGFKRNRNSLIDYFNKEASWRDAKTEEYKMKRTILKQLESQEYI